MVQHQRPFSISFYSDQLDTTYILCCTAQYIVHIHSTYKRSYTSGKDRYRHFNTLFECAANTRFLCLFMIPLG